MSSDTSDELPRIPELEAEYELVRELGRGGTAIVYLARDRELGRDVAIKLIRPSHLRDDDALARLIREARTVGQLQHPNIVMLLGTRRLGEGGLALILQFVPGRTLKQRIRDEGPLPFPDCERILRDLGRALAYAHRRRIVHRDIKPENVYLDDDAGVARLADFGIARAWDSDSGLTLPGTAIGTPTYMSPEQVDGGDLDGRSDLYSLGLLGWELVTGQQPWAGESLYSVIYKQKYEELPALEAFRQGVPANLSHALRGCLPKEPASRWPSAEEFLATLEEGSSLPTDSAAGAEDSAPEPPDPGAVLEEIRRSREGDTYPAPPLPPGQGAPPSVHPSSRWDRDRKAVQSTNWRRNAALLALLLVGGVGGIAFLGNILEGDGFEDQPFQGMNENWEVPTSVSDGSGDAPEVALDSLAGSTNPADAFGAGGATGAEASDAGAGAGDADDPREAVARLVQLQGDAQAGFVGAPLPEPIVIRVEDEAGEPLAGVPIVLGAPPGAGSVSPERAMSDEGGEVRATWTLGSTAQEQSLFAIVEGMDEVVIRMTAMGRARQPATVELASAGSPSATVGNALADPLAVRVLDEGGAAVPGRWVRFVPAEGAGEVSPDSVRTGPDGVARAAWTLGSTPGNQTVEVVVAGAEGVSTSISAVATARVLAERPGLVAGGSHTCSLGPGGTLTCWGANTQGQLGDGTANRRLAPAGSVPGGPFSRATAGFSHSCALTSEGEAFCWGANDQGQLGDGSTTSRSSPTRVAGVPRLVEIQAGASHTCGRTEAGEVFCWGGNAQGQVGDGSTQTRSTPVRVGGNTRFTQLAVAWGHTCALTSGGGALCWGTNTAGELGRASLDMFPTPSAVPGGNTFRQLSAGNAHTCGVTSQGQVLCWGSNQYGQVGDGSSEPRRTPVTIEAPGPFASVSAGAAHTCAVSADGGAYCWGRNIYGQVGDGTTTDRPSPVPVEGGFRFETVHAFGSHTCGRTPGGDRLCWGYNAEGQLGDGTRENRATPVEVGG
ncbi:MAG: protein kinase [Gemmatimonadota bacterium]